MTKLFSYRPYTSFILLAVSFLFGIWQIVLVPLGPHLTMLPGDLGDTRLNNFLLEHFFRWVSGFEKSFWNADFFYPYPYTIAFSDNFLGSGFFYAMFRWIGFDRETAFQGWYIWGFFLNYVSAAFVLSRLKFTPLSVAVGAFFFTFGLPVLAKEGHAQLLYRFGVPLACLSFWQLFAIPKFKNILCFGFLDSLAVLPEHLHRCVLNLPTLKPGSSFARF